ncbi:MAG: GOLPH3/VPS74 family protein [Nocardioidaceae bacterium]
MEVSVERLTVVSEEPTGNPLADAALHRVAADAAAHRPSEWLAHLHIGLRDQVLSRLVQQGVLRREEHRLLGLFARPAAYPAVNPQPEVDVRERVAAIVDRGQPADPRTAALVALAVACDMDSRLSSSAGQDQLSARMEEVASGDPVGPVVRTAINTVDDSLMTAAGRAPRRHRSRF